MPKAMTRLLLIEFFRGALRRNERSMLFPFLKGLAGKHGFKALWICYGGDIEHLDGAAVGRTLFAAMPEEDLRSLSRRLKSFRPTHVVTSDVLSPEAQALLSSCAPPAKHIVMPLPGDLPDASPGEVWRGEAAHCGWFLDWLGVNDPALSGRYLIEESVPDYSAVMANKAALGATPQITIASGVLCANRRTVAKNPYFTGVDMGGLEHRGCSFCPVATRPSLTAPGTSLLPIIETQFRSILKTAGLGGRNKDRYEFFDIRAFWKLDEVFALILRLKVPPAIFLFNPRLDDVLRLRGRIEQTLPALAAAGHEIRILSMGVENFSERENLRFNKDISLAQVDEFLALMKRWGDAYPGVFNPYRAGIPVVEIGLILFTPWTRLEDVRLNLTRAAERGFPGRGYWLYSILLLEPETPIFRLAKREADVLVDRFPDRGQVYGLFKNEGELQDVHPWRFKDAKTADFFAMHVRVCAAEREGANCAFFQGDAAYELALSLYGDANRETAVTPLEIAFALLELLEAARFPYDREELLREAVRRAAARSAQAPAPPEPPMEARAGVPPPSRRERIGAGRLLLLEFVAASTLRNERADFFPFYKGLAESGGVAARWLCVGAGLEGLKKSPTEVWNVPVLGRSDQDELARNLAEWAPTHILVNETLSPELRRILNAVVPHAELLVSTAEYDQAGVGTRTALDLIAEHEGWRKEASEDSAFSQRDIPLTRFFQTGWLAQWLGLPRREDRYFVGTVKPIYDAVMMNSQAREFGPFLSILGGVSCDYRADLSRNPLYRGVDLSACDRRNGCAFCSPAHPAMSAMQDDPIELARTQFSAVIRTAAAQGRNCGRFNVRDIRIFRRIAEFFQMIMDLDLPASDFFFAPRIDDFLRAGAGIEGALPKLADRGHRLSLFRMGVEQFSPRENARFNKGVTSRQIDQGLELAARLQAAHPDSFDYAQPLGYIAFTPWTTLEDIGLTISEGIRRGFSPHAPWLYSALELNEETPIAALALHEGDIVRDRYDDVAMTYGMMADSRSRPGLLPWRFKDRRAAVACGIIVRVCAVSLRGVMPDAVFSEDALYAWIKDLVDGRGRKADRPDLFAAELVRLMETTRPPWSKKKLILRAFDRLERRRADAGGRPAPSADLPGDAGASRRMGLPDGPRQKLGHDGLVFFKDVLGGPPAGWELEQAVFTVRSLSFSLVKGSRRLEFSILPEPRRGRNGGSSGCAPMLIEHGVPDGPSRAERGVHQAISVGLARMSYIELITRLLRDSLLYSDPRMGPALSRLDRYYRINDHTRDFWKFVYPQWRCLEEKVALGSHWVRINYATLECQMANPNPDTVSLRYFADERPDHGEPECLSVDPIITEADVLGGRTQEILGREIERVARDMRPAFIHINTTCMPELIGDTPAPFIGRIERDLGVPVFWTSKTRPGGPFYTDWIERLLDKIDASADRDPRAVLLAGIPSASAQAEAAELCAGLGLRVVGTLFPNLDFTRTPEMDAASAVIWLDPIGWEGIGDEPFLRHGLSVVRYHPPYGLAGTQAWLGRIASVLRLDVSEKSRSRAQEKRASEINALRAESSRRTVALIGDPSDIELLTSHGRAFGFSLASLLGEIGFHVRCLVYDGGKHENTRSLRRSAVRIGAGTIEFVPFSSRARLDRQLARGVDLAFSHLNHDERLNSHGLRGFTEASFEPGIDGLLRSGHRLLSRCSVRPFPNHRSCLSSWTS